MKLAVLGGSFNPVHIGHLALADAACVELGYDKVIFVPTFEPPHKRVAHDFASAEDRLEMLRLATKENPRFEVSDIEIARGGVSYTVDTLSELSEKYSAQLSSKIGFIMGSDLLSGFHLWHNVSRIVELSDLVLASRKESGVRLDNAERSMNAPSGKYAGVEKLDESEREELRHNFEYPHKLLETPILPISSTDIRVMCAKRGSWRYLVPDGVYWYIIKNKLYGAEYGE